MQESVSLLRYDAACHALSLAKSVDEAKDIRDKSEAIRAYARQAKNKVLEIDAVEIRIRAERRLGELLAVSRKAKGGDQYHERSTSSRKEPVPTLAEAGISKKLSSSSQKLAAVPDPVFEEKLGQWRERVEEENERVSTNLLNMGDAAQKHVRGAFGTGENEWYTPADCIELARKVLGVIDLDPASSDLAQETVKAEKYFTAAENGLNHIWKGRVFLNPPYSQPDIGLFVAKLVAEIRLGNVAEAILLTHNYTDTTWFHHAASVCKSLCFTRGRIRFHDDEGKKCSPTQGQAFFYFGNNAKRFAEVFSAIGLILHV